MVKGGLILTLASASACTSLVDSSSRTLVFMGTRIEARVIEMDRNRDNVVLLAVLFLRSRGSRKASGHPGQAPGYMKLKGTVSPSLASRIC